MLGIYVTVPVACFRKGYAREYLETETLPPPATCYGFLLALVGEMNRHRHVGSRVTAVLLNKPPMPISVVLRTVWRVKKKPLGTSGNTRPDYQQLLTEIELLIWLDSSEESSDGPTLETRVRNTLENPGSVNRFGGLCLGESTHLVDEVSLFDKVKDRISLEHAQAYFLAEKGRLTLPVWVDHVGSAKTRYATGDLVSSPTFPPLPGQLPLISPE